MGYAQRDQAELESKVAELESEISHLHQRIDGDDKWQRRMWQAGWVLVAAEALAFLTALAISNRLLDYLGM